MDNIIMALVIASFLGFFLWVLDDPHIPEAKLLGSSYGIRIMIISAIGALAIYILKFIIS